MRYHEPFTLLPRKMPSGLKVYFYRAKAEDGRRTTAWSTGQTTIGADRAHCRLEKAGELLPRKDNDLCRPATFDDLAKDFWSWLHMEERAAAEHRHGRLYLNHPG
jgi:hypothetical protein